MLFNIIGLCWTYLLFLQEQIKDIIIIKAAAEPGILCYIIIILYYIILYIIYNISYNI